MVVPNEPGISGVHDLARRHRGHGRGGERVERRRTRAATYTFSVPPGQLQRSARRRPPATTQSFPAERGPKVVTCTNPVVEEATPITLTSEQVDKWQRLRQLLQRHEDGPEVRRPRRRRRQGTPASRASPSVHVSIVGTDRASGSRSTRQRKTDLDGNLHVLGPRPAATGCARPSPLGSDAVLSEHRRGGHRRLHERDEEREATTCH